MCSQVLHTKNHVDSLNFQVFNPGDGIGQDAVANADPPEMMHPTGKGGRG